MGDRIFVETKYEYEIDQDKDGKRQRRQMNKEGVRIKKTTKVEEKLVRQ